MKYNIIYADPPWYFPGNYGQVGKSKLSGFGAMLRYPVMPDDEIKKLPIYNLAADNCALFLWAVNAKIPTALAVMDAWGFEYKTVAFCWVKTAQNTGAPNCRLGYWTLGGMELCLLGIKGSMKPLVHNIRQVVLSPRQGHSVKPPFIRREISRLFGDIPRIELFARDQEIGWDAWGNEIIGIQNDILNNILTLGS